MKNVNAEYAAKTPAKLNLSLCITGKRENLHTLDMIVYPFSDISDEAFFIPRKSVGIRKIHVISGYKGLKKSKFKKFMFPRLQAIAEKFQIGGDVYFRKNIPLGAGLGGSSACIVSAIKAMQKYCKDTEKPCYIDSDFLLSLGSDVPCMYHGGICRVQGVGETVSPLAYDRQLKFKVAVAKGGSDSAACYDLYDSISRFEDDAKTQIPTTVEEALALNRNDLLEAAQLLNPNIANAIEILSKGTNKKVYMSGSGSAVFCVYSE